MITATVGIEAGTSSGQGVLVDFTERWARHAVHRPLGSTASSQSYRVAREITHRHARVGACSVRIFEWLVKCRLRSRITL